MGEVVISRHMLLPHSHQSLRVKQVRKDSFEMEAHYVPYYELCYLATGERFFFVRDRTYHMVAGDLILVPMNELHRTMDAEQTVYEKLEIDFLPEVLGPVERLIDQADLLAPFQREGLLLRLTPEEQEVFTKMFFQLVDELKLRRFGYAAQATMLLCQLLLFAERIQHSAQTVSTVYFHAKAKDLIQYVNANYKEKLTLDMLADRYQYNPCYLSILFKKITGFTFSQYLNTMRVKATQQLLRITDRDITDICMECGFNSLSHYGRVFKKIVGQSPSEYRKSIKLTL